MGGGGVGVILGGRLVGVILRGVVGWCNIGSLSLQELSMVSGRGQRWEDRDYGDRITAEQPISTQSDG